MQFLDINDKDFEARFAAILTRGEESGKKVEQATLDIINDVRKRGDAALLEYTMRFDRLEAESVAALRVTEKEFDEAFATVLDEDIAALKLAVDRVTRFHEKQKQETWLSTDEEDILLGQMITPLERVGIYVPGKSELSFERDHERRAGQGSRCDGSGHGCSDPRWRNQSPCAGGGQAFRGR